MKVKVSLYPIICLAYALGFIAVGIVVLSQGSPAIEFVDYVCGIAAIAHGLFQFGTVFMRRSSLDKSNYHTLQVSSVMNIAAGFFLLLLPDFALWLLYAVFALYMLVNGLVKLIDFILKYWNGVKGCWGEFAQFIFFLTFTLLFVFVPNMGAASFRIIAGIYCILYGASWVGDFIVQILPQNRKDSIKRRFRLCMPVLLSTFKPFVTIRKLSKKRLLEPPAVIPTSPVTVCPEGKETADVPDIEVLIHVSKEGVGIIGHCDTYFDGEILSYGSYDAKTLSFFGGVADGVFFTADKKRYLRFSVTHDSKTIFGYGMKLTDEQKEQVRARIKELKEGTYPWKAPMHEDWEKNGKVRRSDYKDYGSRLWNGTDAHFYKFKEGVFKTYFVMTSNCAMLAHSILEPLNINISGSNGILSPGCYYDYFENQLSMKDSNVYCKTVYSLETTADWEGLYPEVIPPEDFLPEYEAAQNGDN